MNKLEPEKNALDFVDLYIWSLEAQLWGGIAGIAAGIAVAIVIVAAVLI